MTAMPITRTLVASRRLLTLVLLLVGVSTLSSGCIVVPVGGHGYGGPRAAVVVPTPIVVVRPHRAWWY